MHTHQAQIRLAVAAMIFAILACGQGVSNGPAANAEANGECSMTAAINTNTALVSDKLNDLGTRLCDYTVTMTNVSNVDIMPVVYLHRTERPQVE